MSGATSQPFLVIGEPMIEISPLGDDRAALGVGGDTFNTAVYMSRAGQAVEYVTALGGDAFSARVRARLTLEGIGATCVGRHPTRSVGLYAISLDEQGERSFTYWRSASAARAMFDVLDEGALGALSGAASGLYLTGITLSLFDAAGLERLIELAAGVARRGGMVAFDTNYRPAGWPSAQHARTSIERLAPYVTVALPTFDDDALLFGDADEAACAARWRKWGVGEVCVKAGPNGALLGAGAWIAPQATLRPVDTTGAGDSFSGAYLAARLSGGTPKAAARAGNALAGQVLMHRGAIMPSTAA